MSNENTHLTAVYGMSSACVSEMPAPAVRNRTARELVLYVAEQPQETVSQQRAARVLLDVVAGTTQLDFEISVNSTPDDDSPGTPIGSDEVVVGDEDPQQVPESVTLRVSEPFVGGFRPAVRSSSDGPV